MMLLRDWLKTGTELLRFIEIEKVKGTRGKNNTSILYLS
jgi:hypothetical protein